MSPARSYAFLPVPNITMPPFKKTVGEKHATNPFYIFPETRSTPVDVYIREI
jgi:hypothetical protein